MQRLFDPARAADLPWRCERHATWTATFAVGLAVLLALFGSNWAHAQTEARASITTETPTLNVGDVVALRVTVEHPPSHRVIAPEFDETWGEVEVRDVRVASIVPSNGLGETTELLIAVTAWEPGSYVTPELALKLAAPDGTISGITAGSIQLTVESVLNPEDLVLRDIKEQANLPFPNFTWIYYALGGAGLLAAIAVALLMRRRRKAPLPYGLQEEAEDLRPAHVIALETIDAIESRNLPESGEFKEHYTLIADALRSYLENGFNIAALEATTFEIRRALRKDTTLNIVQRSQVEGVLQAADLVKFAKATPELNEANSLPQTARDFISSTRGLIEVVDSAENPPTVLEPAEVDPT